MEQERKTETTHGEAQAPYEAPRVESIVTADEVEREAHYGGGISTM